MGAAISKSNKAYINGNWNQLKCSPIGPFLQMLGLAPGDVSETNNLCKSSEFSSQFNTSMKEHVNATNKISGSMNQITSTINNFRKVVASMEQRAFKDLSQIATQIFSIYVKIGNIFYLMVKHLMNIMNIFKQTVNLAAAITRMLIEFINLVRVPVNAIIDLISVFTR